MTIAINTRFLLSHKMEGIGWFTYETVKRIVEEHPEHTFHLIFDRAFNKDFIFGSNVVPHVLYPPARHPYLWYLWFEVSIPLLLSRIKPDVFVSPDGYASLHSKIPTLIVSHDLAFKHNPQYISPLVYRYYSYFTPKYLKHAKRIATVSAFSKEDIIATYNINENKIDVLCNGAHSDFRPLQESEKVNMREQFSGGHPYFIYVGAIHPRKNIPNLLKAFELFKSTCKSSSKLLIVGRKAWDNSEVDIVLSNMLFKNDVIFISYSERLQLARLTASALALVYISQFEGFGIPIVEAFNSGTPVITSNVSSMAEVGGEAALLVDPMNVVEIAQAMADIENSPELRESLVRKGLIRKDLYTWDKAATRLWESILKTKAL